MLLDGKSVGIHLVWKKNAHVKEAKTKKYNDMGVEFSVYGEGKDSSSESIWLQQGNLAMIRDEENSRMAEVIGLNGKWHVLMIVVVWEM